MHVAPIRLQIDDGIRDDLAGTVVGDVAARPASEHVDTESRECFRSCGDAVGAPAVTLDAERDDVRVLRRSSRSGARAATPVLDQRTLQHEGIDGSWSPR